MADRDYDMGPTTEMMVNDFDDERTLDEEEALEGSEDSHNELSNLQKEGDMPLKELLAMYGYGDPSTENSNSSDRILVPPGSGEADQSSDKGDNDADDDDDDDETDPQNNEPDLKQFYNEMIVKEDSTKSSIKRRCDDEEDEEDEDEDETCRPAVNRTVGSRETTGNAVEGVTNSNTGTTTSTTGNNAVESCSSIGNNNANADSGIGSGSLGGGTSRLLRSVSRPQSEEEEDDCDYSPDEEEWKKTIMVGSDYQAAIPEGLCRYDDALPYENEDKMLWDPSHIPEEETEEFLECAQLPSMKGNSLPAGSHIRDDEQALYLLLQCGYNLEEALRRRRMNVVPPTDAVSLWSEEECHNFESGLRSYGKDFHLIQKNKVRTRSVGELVQFYYLWKKTERHDIFTYKARLEKKKYALHPGITDYMDRFLEEQEGVRDRSSSPNVHCLIYGDAKRQKTTSNLANNEETKTEPWDGSNVTVDPLAVDQNGPSSRTTTTTAIATTTTTSTSTTTGGSTSPAPPPPPPPLTAPGNLSSSTGNAIASTTATSVSSTPTSLTFERSPRQQTDYVASPADVEAVNSLPWPTLAPRSQYPGLATTAVNNNETTTVSSSSMTTTTTQPVLMPTTTTTAATTVATVAAAAATATTTTTMANAITNVNVNVNNNNHHSHHNNATHEIPSENNVPHLPP